MAIELDPDWPGLTVKSDSSGKGGPELDRTAIKEIAGRLEKALERLTTATRPPVRATLTAKGTPGELPGPPPGAGTLPDMQLYAALSEVHLGKWPTAQQFAMSIDTAYSVLVGERGQKGSGLYAMTTEQYKAVIDTLYEIAKSYDGAEVENEGAAPK
ncbi:hypothetical protein ACFQ08_31180 [Streptosporangium algeriense]|uniref:Uncharacterized protein n=1 Tax=Streptosporangium algeriense TaxID=1682748 RepID=A0ABW3E0V9_9ACTN